MTPPRTSNERDVQNEWEENTNTLYYTILFYTILYYTILYYTILYTNTLIVEDTNTLDYTILFYTILYPNTLLVENTNTLDYTILYYIILYHTNTLIVEAANTLEYYTTTAEKVLFAVVVKIRRTLTERYREGIVHDLLEAYDMSSNGVLYWQNLNNK